MSYKSDRVFVQPVASDPVWALPCSATYVCESPDGLPTVKMDGATVFHGPLDQCQALAEALNALKEGESLDVTAFLDGYLAKGPSEAETLLSGLVQAELARKQALAYLKDRLHKLPEKVRRKFGLGYGGELSLKRLRELVLLASK